MPAESPSYIMVTLDVNLWMRRICSTVSEVPQDATTLRMPSWCIITISMLPSTKMHLSRREISDFAKKIPSRLRLLMYISVSGEFTYLAGLSERRVRPLYAIILPLSEWMGNITLSRNLSCTLPSSLCTARPAPIRYSSL